jgi:protein AATF/BFR2
VTLGPQYAGSRISRNAVEEDEDEEDDPFNKFLDDEAVEEDEDSQDSDDGEEDGDVLNGFGSASDDDMESEEEDEDSQEGDNTSDTEISDGDAAPSQPSKSEQNDPIDRAELRKLMAQDQKSVAATLTEGAKADAEKGKAVQVQRKAFDSLLNTRIKLQKALVATNSLSAIEINDNEVKEANDVVSAAENAAFKLWNNINSLRTSLQSSRTGHKRKHSEFTADAPLSSLWDDISAYENSQLQYRNATLNFWSTKCRATTAEATQPQNRLNQSTQSQQLGDVLAGQLSDISRLVARTRLARSCAPLQAAASSKTSTTKLAPQTGNQNGLPIYDDADFYSTLLQSLISQRSSEATTSLGNLNLNMNMQPWQAAREARVKKIVDTKASKGRKLRYTVHEKLQNFMAPEDRGAWGERQAEDLFGALFGRKEVLGEVVDGVDDEEMGEWENNGEVLKLFAGVK